MDGEYDVRTFCHHLDKKSVNNADCSAILHEKTIPLAFLWQH